MSDGVTVECWARSNGSTTQKKMTANSEQVARNGALMKLVSEFDVDGSTIAHECEVKND